MSRSKPPDFPGVELLPGSGTGYYLPPETTLMVNTFFVLSIEQLFVPLDNVFKSRADLSINE
ncbi:MAG: hypothetical protein KAJ07_07705 [Planctomycetes bacterium]|nr:hypothetical protein [Planctomycetota bacterium]